MFRQRKFQVRAKDSDRDLWVITTDNYAKAERTSEALRLHGYHDVKLLEPAKNPRGEWA
jgi:hypothetical protein